MNQCFHNFIGLKVNSPEVISKSGLYINDLPGIETEQIASLTKSEQVDFNETWNSIYSRSVANFLTDISNELEERFHFEKTLDSQIVGSFGGVLNKATELAGIELHLINSRYSKTSIQTITIWSEEDLQEIDLYFYNKVDGVLLYTSTVDLTVGYNTLYINKEFDSKSLFIAYNPAIVSSYETNLYYSDSYYDWNFTKGYLVINGGGLIVEYNTYCSIDKFVCSRINQFARALLNKIGVELMIERATSDRVNCFTIDSEKAQRLMGSYEQDYNNELKKALSNIKITDDSYCFKCKAPVQRITYLP